ncbi:CYTH domain-containing protein [Streptococcus orisasini]
MIEKEYKYLITEDEFLSLKQKINPRKFVVQENYYFDTENLEYFKHNMTVRIRKKEDLQLQIKNKEKVGSYIESLEQHFDLPLKEIPNKINLHTLGAQVKYLDLPPIIGLVGKLKTERYIAHYKDIKICLDKNFYYDNVDFELELEFQDRKTVADFLKLFNFNHPTNKVGKYERFLSKYKEEE